MFHAFVSGLDTRWNQILSTWMTCGFFKYFTPGSNSLLKMVMEPKEYAEVLEHPIHHLRIWLDAWGIMLLSAMVRLRFHKNEETKMRIYDGSTKYDLPWEPTTFIFRGYNPYLGGVKPSCFMVLGSHGTSDMFHRFTVWNFPVKTSTTLPAIQAVCRVRDPPSHAAPLEAGLSQGFAVHSVESGVKISGDSSTSYIYIVLYFGGLENIQGFIKLVNHGKGRRVYASKKLR